MIIAFVGLLSQVIVVKSQGFIMNVQPSEAEAGFDLRIHPGADISFIEKLISEQWAPKSRNMSYKVELGTCKGWLLYFC